MYASLGIAGLVEDLGCDGGCLCSWDTECRRESEIGSLSRGRNDELFSILLVYVAGLLHDFS